MKKQILSLVVLTAVATSVAVGQNSVQPAQPDFPKILLQPENQMVPMGSNAVFTVVAANGPLACQWFCDGKPMNGQTNETLVIPNAQVSDVASYSCGVCKGLEMVPTRAASLMVFTSSMDPQTGVDPVCVSGTPVWKSGSQGTCPGTYTAYVSYTKTPQQGWGWDPDTSNSNTLFTATDTNRTDTKIQYIGAYGDSGCNQTTVTVPSTAISPAYRFTIFLTNNVPTNPYAITLNGFQP